MIARATLFAALFAALFSATLFATSLAAAELTPQEKRGRHLYQTGESEAGRPVTALLGADAVEVAASVVPCGSCHGRDGRGRPEGGIRPANIQWDVLIHPANNADRKRPAYTKALIRRAITMGFDPSSKALQNTMPKYRLALEDMNDLLAYLEKLGSDPGPGVTEETVRIGAVLPPGEVEQQAVRKMLTAYFERVNRDGGIFGRRIDARFTTGTGTPSERAASLRTFLRDDEPFAVTAAWFHGADDTLSKVAEELRVPTIAAFSTHATEDDLYVFRLLAGVREQSLALVAAAAGDTKPRLAILSDDTTAAIAKQVRKDLASVGFKELDATPADAELVLFLAAPPQLAPLLTSYANAPKPPYILLPVAHSSGDLTSAPPSLDRRILIALPSSPDDVTEEGNAELQALNVAPTHATACRIALASAKLLVEALRRNGRNLDRDALVDTLNTFYRAPTGLTPDVSWSTSRHTGTRGARILAIDLQSKSFLDRGWWSDAR